MKLVCALLVCGVSTAVWADTEHDRIRAERNAANARLAGQERECETRFIVATCLEGARTENRVSLKRLRQQELQLDEGRRRAAADARRKAIADNAEAHQARASDAEAQPPRVRVQREAQAAPTPSRRASDAAAPSVSAPAAGGAGGAGRVSNEQRSEQKFDARARALRAHRESVERRNAQRAAQGKVAAPLPVPAGGSAAR